MTFDIDPTIKLAVSDTRESILANLKKRFASAGIKIMNLSLLTSLINLQSEI
jgi:hypothetical protein